MKLSTRAIRTFWGVALASGFALALARTLSACSSEDPATPAQDADADADTDAATVPPEDGGVEPLGYANVYLLVQPFTRQAHAQSVVYGLESSSEWSCERLKVGACSRSVCTSTDGGTPVDAGPRPTLGKVTWTGFSSDEDGGASVPFEAIDPDSPQRAAAFGGGEPVHVETSGGTIPAYEEDFDVPLGLLVTNPLKDVNGRPAVVLHAGQDHVLTWERGKPGVVFYIQIAGNLGAGRASFNCTFPSESGQGTIPAAITDEVENLSVQAAYTWNRRSALRAGYEVTTGIVFPVLTPDKTSIAFVYE